MSTSFYSDKTASVIQASKRFQRPFSGRAVYFILTWHKTVLVSNVLYRSSLCWGTTIHLFRLTWGPRWQVLCQIDLVRNLAWALAAFLSQMQAWSKICVLVVWILATKTFLRLCSISSGEDTHASTLLMLAIIALVVLKAARLSQPWCNASRWSMG